MALPCILFVILLNSLRVNSQHNLSSQQALLLSFQRHWGYSVSPYSLQWNSSSSPCDWPYVSCTGDMVTGLSLSHRGIFGTFPSSLICQLRNLVSLDMSNNYIQGPIPAGVRECSSLQILDLSWNVISGTIPGEIFLMESLVTLSLGGNNLSGIVPNTIENATSLESLELSNNHNLNGSIPHGITYLRILRSLDLSVNSFSGEIPVELFLMESLACLSLSTNRLFGIIPATIENASSLERLDLSSNYNLNGSIPYGITHLHRLTQLDLSLNSFSGEIPSELFLMESLIRLSLDRNRLFGTIPTTIENARRLGSLNLSNNYLNGSIPDGIANLYNLRQLDLSVNSFSGEIPTRLFHIRGLQSLSLGYNNLSGQLPSYIDLETLQLLNLAHNRLSGPMLHVVFREINNANISRRYLDLADNQLTGEVAAIFLDLARLTTVNLCNNEFSGKVPYEFETDYFQGSCFDRSNLCSVEGGTDSLPSCPSSLCSYDRFHGYQMCSGYSNNNESNSIIITALGIAASFGVVFAILYLLARKPKKNMKSGPSMKEEEEWKMISFQGLKFEKTDILSSLTDENLIGNGGSGKVYRVLTNPRRTYVAVKSISISKISDHQAEKEFLAEIQTLGTIWHYNILKLLCYISGPDSKLLVYEYFENMSLDRWLHGGSSSSVAKLDWPTRMNIAIGTAQGLCYMHHHCPIPIIHRDIKSSNILLDSEFNAKIADFGLAKLLNTCGDTETASAVAGTFGYIAPEYAYTSKVNAKSDVYSFGVVLLELTTGRKAVTRGDHLNLGGWAHLQCTDASATFDALDGEIKEAAIYLDQIVSVFRLGVVCTAALPSNRPSMKDCLHILQNCSS